MAKPIQSERNRTLLPNIESGTEPVILRKRSVHGIIRQVNNNTRKLLGPVQIASTGLTDVGISSASDESVDKQTDSSTADTEIGTGSSFEAGLSDGVSINLLFDEVLRRTSKVRVEDPNDPEVYVEVDRIDRVLLVNKSGQFLGLRFDNS